MRTRVRLTITVKADNDPSCNNYELTESFDFPVSDPPNASRIKTLSKEQIVKFRDSLPHNHSTLHFLPVTATIAEVQVGS